MSVDWMKIRNEYLNGGVTFRELQDKYGVSKTSIALHSSKEHWQERKEARLNKVEQRVEQKTVEKFADAEVNRQEIVLGLADQLLDRVEQAINELDEYVVEQKRRVKKQKYGKGGKLQEETIDETVKLDSLRSTIDRKGLQQVAVALKAIRDVQCGTGSVDSSDVKITFSDGGEDYAG